MLQTYIQVKIVQAKPMTADYYHSYLVPKGMGFMFNGKDRNGYFVKDEDSNESWMPADVFKNQYKGAGELTFGNALELLKLGFKMARHGWNGKGIFISLQVPDENSFMTHPYIYIDTSDNPCAPRDRVPWFATQTDMLAEDWRTWDV
jgi:hypothetical protein